MNLEYFLYQYLLKHQKAEVPDFGVFELTKESAKIDAENSVISPPREIISFIYDHNITGHHLANYISKENNSDPSFAQESIKNEVAAWHQKLKSGNILTLENLGQFQMNDQKDVIKINESQDDIFGLEAINLKALKNPAVKAKPLTEEYSFKKSTLWVFLILVIFGAAAVVIFGDQEMLFGKSSQIPTKKIVKKSQPKAQVSQQIDTLKIDSIKTKTNAQIQKTGR